MSIQNQAKRFHKYVMGSEIDNENLPKYLKSQGIDTYQVDLSDSKLKAYTLYNTQSQRLEIYIDQNQNQEEKIIQALVQGIGYLILGEHLNLKKLNPRRLAKKYPKYQENLLALHLSYQKPTFTPSARQLDHQVNHFTRNFLMPAFSFKPFLKTNYFNYIFKPFETIEKTATYYCVTEDLAEIQIYTTLYPKTYS